MFIGWALRWHWAPYAPFGSNVGGSRPKAHPALVAALAVLWCGLNYADSLTRPPIAELGARWEHVRDAIGDYAQVPGLCQAHTTLVFDSRFGSDRYDPLFIAQLLCRDYDKVIHIAGLNISGRRHR